MILYFSGTGNSHYTAKIIADAMGDNLQSLNRRMRENRKEPMYSEKPVVIVTPTYAWRIPRLVEKLLSELSFEGSHEVYFVMTCGADIGNAARFIRKFCRKKKLAYMGTAEIVMPENYIAMFDVPDSNTAANIILKAEPKILALTKKIAAGEKLAEKPVKVTDQIKSAVFNPLFQAFCVSDKKFHVTGECTGCGICARVCPCKDIRLKEGHPVWNGSCIHCMACINACPKQVIEYGSKSEGKPRYYLKVR